MTLAKLTFLSALLAGSLAFGETTELTVKGMHCSGCKNMIKKSVCADKELSAQFEKCSVELIDSKKQIGKVIITSKADQKVDLEKVEAAIKSAGDDYKVTKKETK